MPSRGGHVRGRVRDALGWTLLGLPIPRKRPDRFTDGASVATSWGAWWARHPNLLRLLTAVALCWSTTYLAWRIGWSWHRSNPVLWACLLLAEIYGLWNLATLAWLTWDVTPRSRPRTTPGKSVDVYICTYDEPPGVLEATLAGCELMTSLLEA
jgi:hypothetical protein